MCMFWSRLGFDCGATPMSRVYHFGALADQHRGLKFDRELLYAGTMFPDIGLMPSHSSPDKHFEVDGANVARDLLKQRRISPHDPACTSEMDNAARVLYVPISLFSV